MIYDIKLFNFYKIPVKLKLWFFLFFIWLNPTFILAIFISLLLHELSHAFVAHKLKYNVSSVYVDFFGGYSEVDLSNIPERDSIKIVLAGPAINLFLFLMVYLTPLNQINFFQSLKQVNLILFIFNILPIYPLDGGRIFRDILYILTKNRKVSIVSSAVTSIVFSTLLLYLSIVTSSYILIIFTLIFIYFGLKDLRF